MLVLGIESSCDETGAAVVADGRHILSNVVASQAELHARYGGVVPEVASRHQLTAIVPPWRAQAWDGRIWTPSRLPTAQGWLARCSWG